LTSESTAAELLSEAKKLRHSTDQEVASKVFINPYLSPAELHLAYEQRKAKRELRKTVQRNYQPLTIVQQALFRPLLMLLMERRVLMCHNGLQRLNILMPGFNNSGYPENLELFQE